MGVTIGTVMERIVQPLRDVGRTIELVPLANGKWIARVSVRKVRPGLMWISGTGNTVCAALRDLAIKVERETCERLGKAGE